MCDGSKICIKMRMSLLKRDDGAGINVHSFIMRKRQKSHLKIAFSLHEQIQMRNLCGKVRCYHQERWWIAGESYQIKEVARNIPCGHIEVHGSEKKNQIKSWHSFSNCNMFIKRHGESKIYLMNRIMMFSLKNCLFAFYFERVCVLARIYQVMRF